MIFYKNSEAFVFKHIIAENYFKIYIHKNIMHIFEVLWRIPNYIKVV